MRKIDDKELMEKLEAGVSQKDIAEHFKVSPSAINQRIKRLKSYQLPDSFNKLTTNRKAFVLAKLEGKNNIEAVKSANYEVTSNESAKVIGSNLMKEEEVNEAIKDMMAQEGINKRVRIRRLRDLIFSKDLGIVSKGLDMSWKLDGSYTPVQVNNNVALLIAWIEEIQNETHPNDHKTIDVKKD